MAQNTMKLRGSSNALPQPRQAARNKELAFIMRRGMNRCQDAGKRTPSAPKGRAKG